jgi:bile acid-coenzyme A ligase
VVDATVTGGDTGRAAPGGLLSISRTITDAAERDPDRPAITCGDRTLTRAELDRRTNRLARAYESLGVRTGDLVTIALANSIEFYEAAVAVWKLGAVPQPVSARLPDRERRAIVELADAALVVGADPAAHPGRHVIPHGFEPDPDVDDSRLDDRVSPAWKAPTSGGSTGRPKLIVAGQPGTVDAGTGRVLMMRPNGTQVVPGPLYHNGPFTTSATGLFNGSHLVVLPRFDAEATLAAVARYRADFLLLVPTMMLRIWRLAADVRARYDLSSLGVIWHLGAPCPPWLKEAWIDWLGPERIFELYAGTEGQAMTAISGADWLAHRGSVGRPVLGEIRIVDPDTGQPREPGEMGEVYLRTGPGSTPTYRYIGAEPRTLDGGWESLGDMGYVDDDGYLYLGDRRTDMILAGGANVYPAEVESALLEHPDVQSCAVVGLPDEELGNVIHAIVQTDGPLETAPLLAFVAERIARYKVPRTVEYVDWPVRDEAGKVRRSALREERLQ